MSVVAASCMRRTPAPPVPRERSRSPLSRRLQGVLEAHERNRRTMKDTSGGIQAKNGTRAIHRHLLEILLEYVVRLLALLDPGAVGRRQFEQRENQVRERFF